MVNHAQVFGRKAMRYHSVIINTIYQHLCIFNTKLEQFLIRSIFY